MTILHRDLKPENGKSPRRSPALPSPGGTRCTDISAVFLGEDNSVKLGDFGLSKMIQSHDFASTYVGTLFYMSPEICAAEKYTLKSDIWSLGCIIYELCTREPPFNAKSHFQLVQRIKEGKVNPLPAIYSAELLAVIKDCLKVNPERRPDTAQLLNLPVVEAHAQREGGGRVQQDAQGQGGLAGPAHPRAGAPARRRRGRKGLHPPGDRTRRSVASGRSRPASRSTASSPRASRTRSSRRWPTCAKRFQEELQAEVDAELAKYGVTRKAGRHGQQQRLGCLLVVAGQVGQRLQLGRRPQRRRIPRP